MSDYTYATAYPPTAGDRSHLNILYGPNFGNVFTTSQTPSFIMFDLGFHNAGPIPHPTTWKCTDIYGTSWSGTINVSNANIGGDDYQNSYYSFSVSPPPAKSSFACGWYRLQTTGAYTASNTFGSEGGDTTFLVVNIDSNFPAPPNFRSPSLNNMGGDSSDEVMGALTGSGPFRWQVQDVTSASVGTDASREVGNANDSATNWYARYASANRPRPQFLQFPNGSIDCMALWSDSQNQPSTAGSTGYASSLNIVTIVSSQSWIQLVAGSQASTVKVLVSQPQNTVVETYDNLSKWSDVVTAINTNSSRLRAWSWKSTNSAQLIPQRSITVTSFNGTKTTVQTCYPTITIFEGPYNEPSNGGEIPAFVALQAQGFKAAVKAGAASAKVMGPCPVSFNSGSLSWLQQHLQALPANFYDIISVHGYNTTNGDMALTDAMLTNFKTVLTNTGYGATPVWMSEAGIFTSVYGVLHWRRAVHWTALWYLLYEVYGIPREQQSYFYPVSRGFWDFPSFAEGGGFNTYIPGPMSMFWRGFTERTYNSLYQSRLSFGGAAASVFFGSTYKEPGVSQTVVLLNAGMPSGQVTLGISTGSMVDIYDWAGNKTTQAIVSNKVTIMTSDLPTYVMVSVTATVSVVDANAGLDSLGQNLVQAQTKSYQETTSFKDTTNSGSFSTIANNNLEVDYTEAGDSAKAYRSQGPFPQEIKYVWPVAQSVSRLLMHCAPPWQAHSVPTQFQVQTWNGSSWVTQYNYTATSAVSSPWVSTDSSWGAYCETYWDEQWIWDIKFSSSVTTTEVRIVLLAGSYGGEPDATAHANGMGQGWTPGVTIREIKIY